MPKAKSTPAAGSVPWSATDGGFRAKELLHMMVWKCLRGVIKREQAVQVIGEMVREQHFLSRHSYTSNHIFQVISSTELASLIPDVLSLVDVETSANAAVPSAAKDNKDAKDGGAREKRDERDRYVFS